MFLWKRDRDVKLEHKHSKLPRQCPFPLLAYKYTSYTESCQRRAVFEDCGLCWWTNRFLQRVTTSSQVPLVLSVFLSCCHCLTLCSSWEDKALILVISWQSKKQMVGWGCCWSCATQFLRARAGPGISALCPLGMNATLLLRVVFWLVFETSDVYWWHLKYFISSK